MSLQVGARLGPYEVTGTLGAGGMGEVYRAHDSRLGRDVALKVLPDLYASDPERLARFQREAQVLAALKHSNIGAIYGLEEAPSADVGASRPVRALVLELIEGDTLADRIARGALALDEALPIAKQIAEALEAAHEQGVIHRDLKPANIKITPDGVVKVLDFGLAKLGEPDGAQAASGPGGLAALSMSPTITSPAQTALGVILGTAAYMAPEQAKGRPADRRSDMWAFGCVLYEMLTGRRAFDGEDISETLAEVIKGTVVWDALPRETPPALRRLLRRCLTKDRRSRIADAGVARMEIDEAIAEPAMAAAHTVAPRRRPAVQIAVAAALAAAITAGAAWVLARPDPLAPVPLTRFTLPLPVGVQLAVNAGHRLAITDDGRHVVYAAGTSGTVRLYVHALDQLEAVPIAGIEGGIGSLFLSPDGTWIGYNDVAEGKIRKVRLAGGPPATISDAPAGQGGYRGAAWGAGGTIVFATAAYPGLMQVADAGGVPQPLTKAEGEVHQRPSFMPDGKAVLFVISRGGADSVAVVPLDTGMPRVLLAGAAPRFSPSGHLVFVRDGVLWAVRFDAERLDVIGEPVPVLEGVDTGGATARYDIAANGTLLYSPGAATIGRTLVWVDRAGREEAIQAPPRGYLYPRLSPDGSRIALDVRDQENDIWIWHALRGTLTRLTFGRPLDRDPVWTEDSSRIIFSSDRSGTANLYWQPAAGTGDAERLSDSSNPQYPSSMAPGDQLVFIELNGEQLSNVMLLPLASMTAGRPATAVQPAPPREPRALVDTRFVERSAAVSSDGRWLAYESNASGSTEIYVRPFPDVSGGQWQVSTSGGNRPMWSRNGRELFYTTAGALMRVAVDAGREWASGTPEPVVRGRYLFGNAGNHATYDISADGRRFLMIKEPDIEQAGPSLIVVENWLEELKRLVPVN